MFPTLDVQFVDMPTESSIPDGYIHMHSNPHSEYNHGEKVSCAVWCHLIHENLFWYLAPLFKEKNKFYLSLFMIHDDKLFFKHHYDPDFRLARDTWWETKDDPVLNELLNIRLSKELEKEILNVES